MPKGTLDTPLAPGRLASPGSCGRVFLTGPGQLMAGALSRCLSPHCRHKWDQRPQLALSSPLANITPSPYHQDTGNRESADPRSARANPGHVGAGPVRTWEVGV